MADGGGDDDASSSGESSVVEGVDFEEDDEEGGGGGGKKGKGRGPKTANEVDDEAAEEEAAEEEDEGDGAVGEGEEVVPCGSVLAVLGEEGRLEELGAYLLRTAGLGEEASGRLRLEPRVKTMVKLQPALSRNLSRTDTAHICVCVCVHAGRGGLDSVAQHFV